MMVTARAMTTVTRTGATTMPTYVYRCRSCGGDYETPSYFSEDELVRGELRCFTGKCVGFMRRVFSPVGTVFKGSGFYRNDNRPKPKPEVTVTKDATVKKDSK